MQKFVRFFTEDNNYHEAFVTIVRKADVLEPFDSFVALVEYTDYTWLEIYKSAEDGSLIGYYTDEDGKEVRKMFTVYNSIGVVIAVTDNEAEADYLAWLDDGYFIAE